MVSIEDFIVKEGPQRINFKNLYLDRINEGQKKTLRLLEESKSTMVKTFIPTHRFIKGIGNTVCNNTKKNIDAGVPCKFCMEFVEKVNQIEKEQFDWLKTLSIVNSEETEKFNNEISKVVTGTSPKIILKNGNVFELGKTFDKDISSLLNEEQKKIYNIFFKKRETLKSKLKSSRFLIPVFDYGTDEVKIFEFGPAIWNKFDEVFTKAGYGFMSADITITNNSQLGNWWSVSKKDTEEVSSKILTKYDQIREVIKKELERRTITPTQQEQEKLFERYKEAVKKSEEESTSQDEKQNTTIASSSHTEAYKDLF